MKDKKNTKNLEVDNLEHTIRTVETNLDTDHNGIILSIDLKPEERIRIVNRMEKYEYNHKAIQRNLNVLVERYANTEGLRALNFITHIVNEILNIQKSKKIKK